MFIEFERKLRLMRQHKSKQTVENYTEYIY